MASTPLISVCIPCYNGEEFVSRTLGSVLNQTIKDFEVVFVDDGSTDRTADIVKAFTDPRIKLHQNKRNLGMGETWNKAVSLAAGTYVKLLCADDLLSPECLARQITALELDSNRRAVLAICNRVVIDAGGKVLLKRPMPFGPGLVGGATLIRRSVRWGSNLIGEPAVGLFRKEILSKNVRYDPSNRYLIDLRFWADLLRHGDVFVDTEYLAAFRVSESASTARLGFQQAALYRTFVRSLRRDPFYRISRLDVVLAYGLSVQWCILRNLFLRMHSIRARKNSSAKQVTHIATQGPLPESCAMIEPPSKDSSVRSPGPMNTSERFLKSRVPC
jgi:glycosyltransferase involved in cell wall biosynthesis